MSARVLLDEARIAAGETLVRRLEERGCAVPAAMWAYESDINEWRLYLAMPLIYNSSPAAGAEQISQAIASLRSQEDFPVARAEITPVGIDHAAVTLIAAAIGTGPALSRLRIQDTKVNGTLIEDVLIYRLYKPGLQPPGRK
jgi:hypothetical protein